jgi:uncharacterized membrane protein
MDGVYGMTVIELLFVLLIAISPVIIILNILRIIFKKNEPKSRNNTKI